MIVEGSASVTLEEITALAKRRGFIFQSSEIYGGIAGFFDYGPLGAVLKRNVKEAWWREMVELRDDVVGSTARSCGPAEYAPSELACTNVGTPASTTA